MINRIKAFRLSSFIPNLVIALCYPIIKTCISENKLLVFSDSCIIVGLLFTVIGIFNLLYLSGDFDITAYITSKFLLKENRSFDTYESDAHEKRKDSFNYPLLTGILLVIISYITALFV